MSYIGKTPEAAGSVPLMAVFWFPLRTALPVGFVAADGQTLLRDTYPDAWNEVNNSRVPIVTDALWNSDVTLRGSFTTGDGSTTFRIPDYNGKSSGSLGAVFLRGDGAMSSGTNGVIQKDAFQGHFHQMPPAFSAAANTSGGNGGMMTPQNNGSLSTAAPITDGINGTPRTASETRPLNVTGCYAVKLFGAVTTQAMLDTSSVAAKVDEMYSGAGRRATSTSIALTGLTTSTFPTDIPSWCKRITVRLAGVKINGGDQIVLQFIDATGTPITTGYVGWAGSLGTSNATAGGAYTNGIVIWSGATVNEANGHVDITFDPSGVVFSAVVAGGASVNFGGGRHDGITSNPKGLLIRTTTNTFAAGKAQLIFE